MKNTSQLVFQHLENISREALEQYQKLIRQYVHRQAGVYALYNNNKLYYVGLARNLNSRLKHHLKDRHADTWDRFSVYLTHGDKHIREIEALLLRISSPKGNRQTGKLKRSENLKKRLLADYWELIETEQKGLFSGSVAEKKAPLKKRRQRKLSNNKETVLSQYSRRWLWLKMTYKGNVYRAHARKDGTIKFDERSYKYKNFMNKVYLTPSAAAKAVTTKGSNGWRWWHFRRGSKWFQLDELRK